MNVRQSVLKAIAASDGQFVSGENLAASVGVSRNAVWKAVKSLENDGYLIEAVSSKGYRISPDNNKLCAEIISVGLKNQHNIIILDETDSTNNYAKKLAANGAGDGTIIIADAQTSGKGRLGRSFVSPPSTGIYMSLLIRPDISIEIAQLITSCAACAAAEAVEELCGCGVGIKWVNDIYMNDKKICGILTEASLSLETKSIDYSIIGIGINVLSIKSLFDDKLSIIASSIEDETGIKISRNRLCCAVINKLDEKLRNIENRSFLTEYRRREILTGNIITANTGGITVTGRAVGIDNNANLVIELDDGSRKTFSSGEANLCRIKKD